MLTDAQGARRTLKHNKMEKEKYESQECQKESSVLTWLRTVVFYSIEQNQEGYIKEARVNKTCDYQK